MDKDSLAEIEVTNSSLVDTNYPSPNSGLTNPYVHLATSENTRKAYRNDICHYENWGGKLPASPEMIANYLNFYADKLNPRTLSRRLIAIKHWHTYQAYNDPTNHPAIQKTMTGILRTHGKPKEKAHALAPDELAKIHASLKTQHTLAALRDDALLQIGFFGALRRSELIAIKLEHLTWTNAGIQILIPHSKTDQSHSGQYAVIPYGNETLCPIHALKKWLAISEIKTGAIFRRIISNKLIGSEALTPLSVNHILKNRAEQANLIDIKNLSSHSLRRGLATSAARAGVRLEVIMRSGRWKQTNTVIEYIEANERFADNAASKVMLDMQKEEIKA